MSNFDQNNITKDTEIAYLKLGLTDYMVQKLNSAGYYTLEDLSKTYVSRIKDIVGKTNPSMDNINIALKKVGLKFRVIEDNYVYDDPTAPVVDVEKLSPEETEEFFLRPVCDIGLSIKEKEVFGENNIKTIGDLSSLSLSELSVMFNDNRKLCKHIYNALASYNIYLESQLYYTFSEPVMSPEEFNKLSNDEKKEFYKRGIEDLGLSQKVIKLFKDVEVYSIDDLFTLTKKELLNIAKELKFIPRKKLLNRLSEYGIEPPIEYGVYAFQTPTKEKLDFEKATEEEIEKYLDSSIVGMGMSQRIENLFINNGVNTLRDMSKLRSVDVRRILKGSPTTQDRVKNIIESYGIKLTEGQTHFEDLKIDVFNINDVDEETRQNFLNNSIKILGIYGPAVDKLKQETGGDTINDLLNLGYAKARDLFGNYTYKPLTKRLDMFGLKYKTTEKAKESNSGEVDIVNVNTLEEKVKSEYMSLDLSSFDISYSLLKLLKDNGIDTLEKLSNIQKKEIREFIPRSDKVKELEIWFAQFGLKLKGSNCYVVNGKVVSKNEDIENIFTEKKVQSVKIDSLTEEEKEKILNTPIEHLGLLQRVVDLIQDKTDIKTLGDLSKIHQNDIKKILCRKDAYLTSLYNTLNEFGIVLSDECRNTETKKINNQKLLEAVTEEQKLALSIEDIGLSSEQVKLLAKNNFSTVQDLMNKSKSYFVILSGGKYYFASEIDKTLKNLGFNLPKKDAKKEAEYKQRQAKHLEKYEQYMEEKKLNSTESQNVDESEDN